MKHTIWKSRLHILLLFCLAVLCWSLSGNAYAELRKQSPTTTFQGVESLLAEDYEQMLRTEAQAKEALAFTLWTQTDNQRLEGLGTDRTQNVAWIAAKGNTRLLFPVMQTLHEEDADGCLIDRQTAEQLFRNKNAVGSIVKMRGKEYTVRGVIDGPHRTIVTQLAQESGHAFSNVTVSADNGAETFLLRHGLTAAVTVKSSQYVFFSKILYFFPVMSLVLVCLLFLGRLREYWRLYQVRYLLVSVGMLAIGTVGLLLLFPFIPERLIPSQWSDFEFWETAGRDFFQVTADFISSATYRPDMVRLHGVLRSAPGILSAHFIMRIYNLLRIRYGSSSIIALSWLDSDEKTRLCSINR